MGKTHLAKIVEAVRRIAAKPLILRALTDKPVLRCTNIRIARKHRMIDMDPYLGD